MRQPIVIISLISILSAVFLSNAHAKPRVSVIASQPNAAEKGGVRGQFQLSLDAPDKKPVTVSYAIGGNAKVGKDYKKMKAKTTIKAGQTVAYIDIIPVADKKAEKPKTVKLTLKNGRNYQRGNARSATVQITDNPVPGAGGGSSGSPSGTLYWCGTSCYTLNLAAGTNEPTVVNRLSFDSQGQLGYGGGMFTEVESTDVVPEYITINLRNLPPNTFTLRSKFGPFPIYGSVLGPVQPSPDGRLFAMSTQEDTSPGVLDSNPKVPFVYVFDAALDIIFKLEGYGSRSWLGNDRIVVTSGSNLYTVTVSASPVVTRVGPDGLGLPNEAVSQPSVSPDGRSIAFVQGDAVWRINVDGSGLTQLTKPRFQLGWPSWSPDGSRLVVSNAPCQFFDIGVIGPGGTGRTDQFFIISATAINQDFNSLRPVTSDCGPVYWLP